MRKWTVRTNCEYSHTVEADSEEAALRKAAALDVSDWHTEAWAPMEAEED